MAQIKHYIEDRYPQYNAELLEPIYIEYLFVNGYKMLRNSYGFLIYKFEGDACIIRDIYTDRQHRKTKKAWTLWLEVLQIIQNNPLCKVIIGFSEKDGIDQQNGVGAMLAAGFVKSQELADRTVYMRGTQ